MDSLKGSCLERERGKKKRVVSTIRAGVTIIHVTLVLKDRKQ